MMVVLLLLRLQRGRLPEGHPRPRGGFPRANGIRLRAGRHSFKDFRGFVVWHSGGPQREDSFLLLLLFLSRIPLGIGSHGSSGVRAIGSNSLVLSDDGTEGALDGASDPLVKQ